VAIHVRRPHGSAATSTPDLVKGAFQRVVDGDKFVQAGKGDSAEQFVDRSACAWRSTTAKSYSQIYRPVMQLRRIRLPLTGRHAFTLSALLLSERVIWSERLADNPFHAKRFGSCVGRRCRDSRLQDIAREVHLDWKTVNKALDKQYMEEFYAWLGEKKNVFSPRPLRLR
jgi:hypothetical protein